MGPLVYQRRAPAPLPQACVICAIDAFAPVARQHLLELGIGDSHAALGYLGEASMEKS